MLLSPTARGDRTTVVPGWHLLAPPQGSPALQPQAELLVTQESANEPGCCATVLSPAWAWHMRLY